MNPTQPSNSNNNVTSNDDDENRARIRTRDPTYWPMTFQLTLTGRERELQLPSDTMLADALNLREAEQRSGRAGGTVTYAAKMRMWGVDGPLGSRGGVGWRFGIGAEGVEGYADG